ncbi:MAG: hypothetical protein C4538_01155 [Nitrospiraceae bacterium]|nr:MAG: hypothetical protein C4538_01155 [Nitrospiraceae bacterium]
MSFNIFTCPKGSLLRNFSNRQKAFNIFASKYFHIFHRENSFADKVFSENVSYRNSSADFPLCLCAFVTV